MNHDTPLRIQELTIVIIGLYGLGSTRSQKHKDDMQKALEGAGLAWRTLCPHHEKEIETCLECKKGEWHIKNPETPDPESMDYKKHAESFFTYDGDTDFLISHDIQDIDNALSLLENHLDNLPKDNETIRKKVLFMLQQTQEKLTSNTLNKEK